MSTRERNVELFRLVKSLQFWHERWTLEGLYVACPGCHTQQLADDAREPFMHVDGCALATEFAKHPWIELRDLLADLPPVPA